jgi:hypothetical protein
MANEFRLLIHTAAYWLMLTLRGFGSQDLVLAQAVAQVSVASTTRR